MAQTFEFSYSLSDSPDEDSIWRKDIAPGLTGIPENVFQVCQYGFAEMVNNVIEHSGSERFQVVSTDSDSAIGFTIIDQGVGIFNKIKNDLRLDDPRHAILELAKGKYTSDPQSHSGEGIFFTSRIFDYFAIFSEGLSFWGNNNYGSPAGHDGAKGTHIVMKIRKDSPVSLSAIFNEYADPDKQPGFYKTIIPVRLLKYGGHDLMSRSQAKRLTTRFERFLEVILDFSGITFIGQGFADEVFRVFANAHPAVHLTPVNCAEDVQRMIAHVIRL
jgi:anti-sigma regulatory factor (Ser/Thr protein kinase)